jgi:hypothetical protein
MIKPKIQTKCIFHGNVRKNRGGNQNWTIQRNWQHCVHKTQDEEKQKNIHNYPQTKVNNVNM